MCYAKLLLMIMCKMLQLVALFLEAVVLILALFTWVTLQKNPKCYSAVVQGILSSRTDPLKQHLST